MANAVCAWLDTGQSGDELPQQLRSVGAAEGFAEGFVEGARHFPPTSHFAPGAAGVGATAQCVRART
eukprot:SAG25_NODE_6811_length_528_cov_0.603730_1_plen_66_part_10